MHLFTIFVCVAVCASLIGAKFISAQGYERVIPTDYEFQKTNIFPGQVTAVGWANSASALSQDISEDALYGDFNKDTSAHLEQFTTTVPEVSAPTSDGVVDAYVPSGTTTPDEGVVPDTTGSLSEDEVVPAPEPEPVIQDEVVPEPAQETEEVPVDTSNTGETVSSAVFEMVRGAYSFAATIFSSSDEEVGEEVVDVVPVPEPETAPEDSTVAEPEVLGETTTPDEQVTDVPAVPEDIVEGTPDVSEVPDTTSEVLTTEEPAEVCEYIGCFSHVIEFADFSVGDGFEEQQITNIQLRMSLGALPHSKETVGDELLRVEYFHDGEWMQGGLITIDDEISNALNGGYQLFAFPIYDQWTRLSEVKVRLSYGSNNEELSKIYLDSVWLEVESINGNAFNESLEDVPTPPPTTEQVLRQDVPEGYVFDELGEKKDFAFTEDPKLAFKILREEQKLGLLARIGKGIKNFFGFGAEENTQRPLTLRILNEELRGHAEIVDKGEGEFEVAVTKARQFKPGKYVVTIEVSDENGTFYIDQEFSWGVLAINTDKSIYLSGEEAYLQMGVLDDFGHTICDAALELEITSPSGNVSVLSTSNGAIAYGPECAGDTFTTTPDYDTRYRIEDRIGRYSMKLTATTANGVHTITDAFEVREAVAFDVVRTGPTRIYPPALYPVTLNVTANEDFKGEIIEYVPQSFQVYESEDSSAPFRTHEVDDVKQLIWNVSLRAGETVELAYEFDAPDISPEFYLLGPLQIGEFTEIREWQIASDAPDPAIIVQSVVGTPVSATTYSATLGAAPTIGNVIIMAAIHRDNAVSFTTPGGFTQAVYSDTANFIDVGIWYKVATNTLTTYSISKPTGGNESGVISLMEVDGLDTTDLVDVVASNDQTATNARISFTGATAQAARYGFAVAASGWGDDDFTDPTTASWSSSSTDAYVQRSWTEWAVGNAGSFGVAYAHINAVSVQGARLTVTGGGSTEDRNSAIAVFNLAPQITTVSSIGNQVTPLIINTNNKYVGGAFSLVPDSGTTTVTSITITETGTTDAQNDLSGIKLKYEMDTTAPYNCASVSYAGTETQYGATSTSFTSANGTATFNGSVTIASTSAMCVYPVVNIDSSATDGHTLEIQIANPSTQVVVNEGTVTPGTAVSISDTTNLSVGYVPNTPNLALTPAFESYRATTTTPRLGGFAAIDLDGNNLEYGIIIDNNQDLSSPVTTKYSSNYPTDSGWASTTFASGATTTYIVRSGDGLTAGTTYWWGVKARDPSNTNRWSATSTAKSFTVGSSITVPEWYQTTYEQLNQSTFTNTLATTSGSVIIASTTQSFNWLTTPIDVSPGTAGSWVTVDVSSYVPSGATGAILRWDISNSGADRALGFRHGDSTDNRITTVEQEKADFAFAGLNSSRQFDAYVGANTVDVYLVGYTTNGVTFFTNSANKTLSSNSTWGDISIASDTGANTAVGAIVEIVHATNNDTWGIRKNGSTDNRTGAYGRYHNWAIIGVDGSEIFEGWANDITDTTFHVIGYVTEGAHFFTNAVDRTPSAGIGWVDVDITGDLVPGDNAIGAFVEVYGTDAVAAYGLRQNGDTSTGNSLIEDARRHAWGVIAVDSDDIYEAQLEASSIYTNSLIGYATANAEGSVMSDPVDFDHVTNQNDWGEVRWSVTEPAGSDTYVQVYYGASCSTLVPNGTLPGNTVGFAATTSPINISALSTSTYNQICIKATLDQGTAGESPSLDSWNISWERKPVYAQESYWWYVNTNANTPTDRWPAGATDLAISTPISSANPTKTNDVLRLRMGVGVTSVTASTGLFKLQYAAGETCSAGLVWADVGAIGSTTALWRGYNNTSVSDGATLTSQLLTGADELESYEEENLTASLANAIVSGDTGEWDFVLQNRALPGTSYCFRMVGSDGELFATYTNYPIAVTNFAPVMSVYDTPFDNEKVGTTTPVFEFYATDAEEDDVDYQIQIDNDIDFSSTAIDTNSASNANDFENVPTPADKSPFYQNERIRYTIPSALTNGTTYWWRVRPKDPNGSDTYGEWSELQSFTVDTTVTIATWFQTTEEQFDMDTLENTDATASDLVNMPNSSPGTTTSQTIDFDDADTGNAWGSLSWTDNEATGDIKYRVEYYNGSSWVLIPNSALPSNSSGFDTSPVDLIDLDTEIYNQIRIRANFTYSGGSPTLSDWTVSWGERVSVVTHMTLFDNEKTGTTSPTFTFTTTDPQGQDLEYEISYSTDVTFTTGTTTRRSNIHPGFVNLTSGGDTNPFYSGDTISYKIQSPLTNGTTYWWRVRAKDPAGSNSYSFWSDPWSFTVDTTVDVSTWFQTTQEQFETDELTGVVASTTDQLTMLPPGVSTYNFVGVTSPSATHVARDFEVDVLDPTDPPTVDAVDTITTTGTTGGAPNLRTSIAGYASDAQATSAQYTQISTSNNVRWQITDPGLGDNAVFWTSFHINESPDDINQIDVLLEGYQAAATDVAWLAIWRPGAATPYWQDLSHSQRTGDFNYTASITSNVDEYVDSGNNIYIMFFNEDDSDSLFVDYVEVEVTSGAATEGTAVGTPVDYNDGSGPAWGQMLWTDTTPGASNILYQLQYLDTLGNWTLVPDVALAGNSSGFTTAPVDLQLLNTTTYNEVRLVANIDCSGVNCPSLQDWTLEWSEGFDISGTAVEYNGTASTTSGTVAVAVNGALQIGKTGTILANGTWTIDNVTFYAGDTITVFVSGAADADEAVAVTTYDGTPGITGMRLQKRFVTIGSNDNGTVTNTDIGEYNVNDDEDLFFDVSVGNDLDMCATTGCFDAGIAVLAGDTYSPGTGADILTHDFINYGTFIPGSNTVRLSGLWDNNATTTMTGSTVIFTATSTTESIDQTGAVTTAFNNVTFGETSGAATWNLITALDVDGNLNVTYGTLGRNTQNVLLAGNITTGASGFWTGIGTTTFDGTNPSTWTDNNATDQNIGRVLVDGTSKTLLLGSSALMQSMTIGANDTFDLGVSGFTASVYRNWINNNTFTPRTGTVIFIATSTNKVITVGGDAFYNLQFNGTGASWSFTEAALTVSNDLTFTAGTVTMPTGTTTLTGSFVTAGGTFAHNNSLVYFNSSAAETITLQGTAFTNALYNARFTGSGSWSFTEAFATTSNQFRITQGTVTLPSNTLTVGGSFTNSAGSFAHNNGAVKFTASGAQTIDTNASFNDMRFTGSGSWSFVDASLTALGDITVSNGTLTLPSGTFTVGGGIANTATLTHNNGTVLFNSTDTGETISLGNSTLYNATFNSATGGWTISNNATTTNNTTLTAANTFTLTSGRTLAVGGTFTNSVGGASTTWTGSTLSLEAGNYSLNTKTNTGDAYNVLRIKANTDIKMWNSSASTYTVDATGSLYSQDHSAVDGDLYIYGNYPRTSGTEHWSYATDFDGTALGGGSRQVDVRFASGASASFSNSTLSVIGTGVASTTIANQGSGTYTIGITAGTTTMNRYDFDNLGATGVSFSGQSVVTSLSYGAFTPSVAAGAALSIASSSIDRNPGLQIYNVDFSTTTAISAFNVAQTSGVPASYWWFRQSTGNIDGEARDNDTGDPGSIRWDDSSLVITVSGTVYSDDGVTPLSNPTCDGAANVVRVVVENGSSYIDDCDSGTGDFSIAGVVIVGDPVVTVYLDTNGGVQGSVVTKTPTADITDLDVYANRVMTRHEDILPLTIEDMAVFDSGNDSDVRFTAATGTTDTLVLPSNTELHVASSTTFAPGGEITINANATGNSYDGSLHIDNNATFTAHASSTISIGGSFTADVGGVFTAASSTVLMTATTTGKTVTGVSALTFNQLTFNGISGGWNINTDITVHDDIYVQNGTVTGTEDIALTTGSFYGNGTVSLGNGTTTLYRTNTLGGTTPWTFANLVLGNGSVVGTTTPASSATSTILGRLTISAAHFLDAGDANFELRGTGNAFVETGTFLEDTSNVRYSGTSGANVLSTRYYDLDVNAFGGTPTFTAAGSGIQVTNNLSVGGTAATTFTFNTNDPALDVNGNVTIRSNGTFIGSNSATTTIAGNYDNDGTFTGSGGVLTFDGSASTNIAAGNSAFSSVRINGTGTFTISEHATTSAAFTLTNAGSFTLNSGVTLAVAGLFTNAEGGAATTWTGSTLRLVSGTNYQINAKTINDVYNVLVVGVNTDIRMWNSSASTYTVDATGSLYSQDHSAVDGDLYVYGNYPGNGGTDYWSYATDFDGTALGGGSRQVDVRFASGASAVLTTGGLQVLGSASASTSLQNQGSGMYGLRVGGNASTTWSYYDIEDTNTSGLVLSGAPNVVTLSRGDIEVSQGGGSAITVGGTVISANPAKNFTNNIFATTTGISAFNVTATGTTVSSWRFTNHSGQIDGEAFDVDPDGDPGYIVWDNSAANISISGNVYSDEGSTVSAVCGGSSNIRLVVAGLSTYDTTCNAGTGLYTFTGVSYGPTDSLVVFINGETAKAASVTADPVSNISGLHLYENRVIVRHENTGPLTIDDMAVYDSSDDADIPFTAVSGAPDTLTLPANRKLIVWTAKEFEPNGNVTVTGGGGGAAYDGTLELLTGATFDANGTETHTIGGSLISGSTASVDDDTSTFVFTTSGVARTVDANDNPFYNLTFNGSGSWSVTDTILTVGNDLTITQGTVTLPAATTTITGSLQNTGGSFVASGGVMIFNSSAAETIRPNTSSFATLLINGTGSFAFFGAAATTTNDFRIIDGAVTAPTGPLTIAGDFVNDDTFTHNGGTLRMTSATAGTLLTLGGSDASSVTFAGSGSFIFTDGSAALLGTLRITQGAVTLATGTLSVAGSFLNTGGSFAHASGTVLFNSSDVGETVNPGSSSFFAVNVAAPTGGYTFTNHATTTGSFSITSATSFALSSGMRLAVRGVFTNLVGGSATTWTGSTLAVSSGSNYTINTKVLGGDVYNRLIISANTDLRMWNSSATTTVDSTSSLYSQDNAAVNGALYIYGDYARTSGTDYWSYATDFDGTSLTGSERAVTVSMAQNATTTLSGGTLAMVGAALGTTTVTNQGSGTYTLNIQSGTLNAQYYALRNMDRDGLRLSGTTAITSLAYGDYVLAVSGGSLITLASTTLNQNASLVIPGTRFATTTAITGANVEVVGTTPSAWTFTAHRGNFDGEAFDIDGGDACGSVRWSDSACLLTQQSGFRWRNDDGGEGVPDSEWFDLDWNKRKRVEITNADAATYTNAAVKFTVAYDADMQADFDDLRFTDSSGTTTLSHFIETYTASTDAVVWVKVPSLAASSDTEIYMYYSNGAVSDASVGTTTFTYFDGFEDDNITEYSGDTSLFNVGTDFNYERTYGLDALGHESAKATDGIFRTDVTISQGQTFRFWQYIDAAGSQDEVCTLFGIQTPGTGNDNYGVCLEQVTGIDRISIARDVESTDTEGTGDILASTTVAYSVGWYEVEVDWDTDDTIFVSLYEADGTLVATTSAMSVLYTSGGIGFTFWFQNGGWDTFSARPLVETDPTVSFGFEQVPGGATWLADLNELASGVNQEDVVRARFLIENTGLTVTDQNYVIEFAEKGGAPSCEAVNYNDYVEVPNQASCGSSPICLEASSQFTNGAATTDVLGGIGTFTPGEIREDPVNATGNITIDNDEYTELEYAVTPTLNATDSNYCFRVTDGGSELDSYTEVAELTLRFDPVVSTIVLNGGQPITLSPGATTTVYATGTVSDQNGWMDLDTASSTMYRSGVTGGAACTANNNDCYISSAPQCSFSNCAGNSCDISCTADMYFFADPTDAGTYSGQNWLSYIEVSDQAGGIDIGSSPGIELMTLRAIGVDSTISYGSLAVSADTGSYNPTTTVENIGNDNIDVSLEGTDLTDGSSSVIPVSEQLYATSTFTYAACTFCNALASTSVNYEVDLSKPTTTTPVISDVIYWGIEIPFGTAGTAHQGTNLFTAIGDI